MAASGEHVLFLQPLAVPRDIVERIISEAVETHNSGSSAGGKQPHCA